MNSIYSNKLIYQHPEAEIAYETTGTGEWVIFCHALATCRHIWREQVKGLSEKYRMLIFDLPGHGDSSKLFSDSYSFEKLAEILKSLMDHLGIEKAKLVGLSVGGEIAQVACALYPERFQRLVLISTACYSSPERVDVWNKRLDSVTKIGMAGIARETASRWFSENFSREHPEVIEQCRQWISNTSVFSYIGLVKTIQKMDLRVLNGSIACVTKIFYGEFDHNTGLQSAELISSSIRKSELVRIDGVGHFPNLEKVEKFNNLLMECFQS